MQELRVVVNNKVATYMRRDGCIVCGNSDYVIVFAFDAEWDAHETKTARFVWNNLYTDVPFTGDRVHVPIVSDTTLLKVGVYAGELSTTTPASIDCKKSILCGRAIENSNQDEPPEIPEGYIIPEGEKTITENGSHDVREFATAVVAVPPVRIAPNLQEKFVSLSGSDSTYRVEPDEGYDGLAFVEVGIEGEEIKLQDKQVLLDGAPATCLVEPDAEYDGLSSVEISVRPTLRDKEITENGEYTPPAGVLGFSKVTVNVESAAKEADTVELDFSGYESGSFTETLSDGRVVTHTVIFDGYVPIWVDNIDVSGV